MWLPQKRYLLPGLLVTGLFFFLTLWVTYEFLHAYSIRLKEERRSSVAVSRVLEQVFFLGLLDERTGHEFLENIISSTDLVYIQLNFGDGRSISAGANPVNHKSFAVGVEDQIRQGDYYAYWTRYGNLKSGKIITVADTTAYYRDMELRTELFLTILLLGCGVIFVAIFAWSFLVSNINLKLQLKSAKAREEQAEELSLAATGLAHETKNPLGLIRGIAQQISRNPELPSGIRAKADDIMEQADVTSARLGDFLCYARLPEPDFKAVNLPQHVVKILSILEDDCRQRKIELVSNVENITVSADPDVLSQIMMNLVLNSINSMEDGGRIRVSAYAGGNREAAITVEDNGPGIPEEMLPKIFKPYFTENVGGYGIGLAIVKKLVDNSGWSIIIASEPGEGTSVTLKNIDMMRKEEDV